MGRKVNPVALRLGVNRRWNSTWVARKRDYAIRLHNDLNIRDYIDKELFGSSIDRVEIAQFRNSVEVNIYSGKPAVLIGRNGERVGRIKDDLEKISTVPIKINIREVMKPDLSARITAESIADQLKRRAPFKRVLPFAISRVMDAGATGVRIQIAGRLGGREMKSKEVMTLGRVPLQTISADIDYSLIPVRTDTGIIGVKVWIYKGDKR